MRAMDRHIRWFSLELTTIPKVLLVLDASESAEEYEEEVLGLASGIIAALPHSDAVRAAFLGGTELFSAEEFSAGKTELWKKNLGRCSLINPVLRAACPTEEHRVVIIGTGTIFDLEDQAEMLGHRLLLASVGQRLGPDEGSWSSLTTRQAEEVVDQLWSRVTGVTISGRGLLPICWDHDGYRLALGSDGAALRLEGSAEPSTRVGFLAHGDGPPAARVAYADGREVEVPLKTARSFDRELRPVRLFTAEEAHPFYLTATDGPACGPAVLPRMCRSAVPDWSGFILVAESAEGLAAYAYPWEVIATGPDRVAAYQPGGVVPIVFDPLSRQWRVHPEQSMGGCLELGGGVYGVAL
ncbi:MAG TPA: hypothetical protein PKY77_03420 [Phycisphaerae bacterium]|nr:hypothetical protein [Phycisphaerae bacterium]HRY67351.1 hypothetical protein [Phycisphaerae bacterium]HSA29420.1 hypothetical protein [Phycisphaerae bacterium]